MANTADVIIIGGGIHGASLAFHLARRGAKPLLLEKKHLAAGATGRSSGLVRMHYDTEMDSRLAWESFAYFRNWKEMVGGECGFTRTGFVQIVEPKYEAALRANVAMHQQIGIPAFLVTADDVKRLVPAFATDDFTIAAYEPESGYAMPSDAAQALLTAAIRHGVRFMQDCAVTAIKTASGKVCAVETTQGEFSTAVVVNAAGAWAGQINQMVGLELPYDTWRHDTMFVAPPAQMTATYPTVIDFPGQMYFRAEGNLMLVGLEDGNPMGESPDNDTSHARPGFVERAIDRLCGRVPVMEHGGLHSAHGGYDGITPDQHAILGAAGPDGFYLDCGHSGTGFKTAPAIGLCMSELILDGAAHTVDISALSPDRFANGKLIKGNYGTIWR